MTETHVGAATICLRVDRYPGDHGERCHSNMVKKIVWVYWHQFVEMMPNRPWRPS